MEKSIKWQTTLAPIISFTCVFMALRLFPTSDILSKNAAIILAIACYILGFLITLYYCGAFLKEQWNAFKLHKWTKFLWIIAGYAFTLVLITYIRKAVTALAPIPTTPLAEAVAQPEISMLLLSMTLPLLAPFYEEIVFRFAIFKQLSANTASKILMAIVSAVAFGLIHYGSFSSLLGTIPYMFVGLFFCWVYYKTNNIFYSILIHLLLNWINTLMSLVGLLLVNHLGG